MKLYFRPESPHERKIMVAAIEAGLETVIDAVPVSSHQSDGTPSDAQTPLLVRRNGPAISGSVPICDYLDHLNDGPKLMPDKGEARLELTQVEALAEEIVRAAENDDRGSTPLSLSVLRPLPGPHGDLDRGLDQLERLSDTVLAGPVTLGHIAVGCALDWLDQRRADGAWRTGRPALAAWYDRFHRRPSMEATNPRVILQQRAKG